MNIDPEGVDLNKYDYNSIAEVLKVNNYSVH